MGSNEADEHDPNVITAGDFMAMPPTQRREFWRKYAPGVPMPTNFGTDELEAAELGFRAQFNQAMIDAMDALSQSAGGMSAASLIPKQVLIAGKSWRAHKVGESACRSGCDEIAEEIQRTLGGDLKTIKPRKTPGLPDPRDRVLGPVRDEVGSPFKNPAGDGALGWYYHRVVVKNGRVYDLLTGPAGELIETYKKRWQDLDLIDFGF